MDNTFNVEEFCLGFDVEIDAEQVVYSSDDGIATLMDAHTGEIFILEIIH